MLKDAETKDNLFLLHAGLNEAQHEAYIADRIPNSVFFDVSKAVSKEEVKPIVNFRLPEEETFAEIMEQMDVRVNDLIVCYDAQSFLAAPRTAWMFRMFGAKNVHILNSTLQHWKSLGLETVGGSQGAVQSFRGLRARGEPAKTDFAYRKNHE
mmetsp:Transcript_11207/g.18855  ORF Transcript_11207/g.18855 Transcript_11207/m.18855 type:complete len:153 (+) Transcript_11207:132-590(+)